MAPASGAAPEIVVDHAPWFILTLGAVLTFYAIHYRYRQIKTLPDPALLKESLICQYTELLAVLLPFVIAFSYSCLTTGISHVLKADELSLAAAVLCSQAAVRIHQLAWRAPAEGTSIAMAKSTARLLSLIALCIVAISPIAAAKYDGADGTLLEYVRIALFLLSIYFFMVWGGQAALAIAAVNQHNHRTTAHSGNP